jgi:hypothetical protein
MIKMLAIVMFALMPMGFMQSADEIATEVSKAIGNGNSRALARHFGPNVELYLPGAEGTFSRSQSEVILRDFFSKNPPSKLTISRQEVSRDGSIYVIGILRTRDGSTYRMYYLIKRVSQTYVLHQLQAESQ